MNERYTSSKLCRTLGRSLPYVRSLQSALHLPLPDERTGYSPAYLVFLQKVVAMRALSVPLDDIGNLFVKEKNLLKLLNLDTVSDSPTWFLDRCHEKGRLPHRLLLTGYDIGFSPDADAVQTHLDFGQREKELFAGREMGEDVRKAVKAYRRLFAEIRERIEHERPILQQALEWAQAEFAARERGAPGG